MGDEPNEEPYRPKGPALECNVRSTPRWKFALWGIWAAILGVLSFARATLRGFVAALFGVPTWLLSEHVPDLLADIGRVHGGIEPVRAVIPTKIWGLDAPGVKISGDWIGISIAAWVVFSFLSVLACVGIESWMNTWQ